MSPTLIKEDLKQYLIRLPSDPLLFTANILILTAIVLFFFAYYKNGIPDFSKKISVFFLMFCASGINGSYYFLPPALIVSYAFLVFPEFKTFLKNASVVLKDRFLCLFMVLAFASALWSRAPRATLSAALLLPILTLVSVHIVAKYGWRPVSHIFRLSFTAIIFLSVFALIFMRWIAIDPLTGGWRGILMHKNILGEMSALNLLFWIGYLIEEKKERRKMAPVLFIIALSLTMLFLAKGAGGLFSFFVAGSILVCISLIKNLDYTSALKYLIAFIWGFLGLLALVLNNMAQFLAIFQKDITFTGRIYMWRELFLVIKTHPLIGAGYGYLYQPRLKEKNPSFYLEKFYGDSGISSAHNGFIEIALYLGIIGLIVILLSISRNMIKAIKYAVKNNIRSSVLPLALLVFFFLVNSSASRLTSYVNIYWLLYVMISAHLSMETDKQTL